MKNSGRKIKYLCLECGYETEGYSNIDGKRCKECKGVIVPIFPLKKEEMNKQLNIIKQMEFAAKIGEEENIVPILPNTIMEQIKVNLKDVLVEYIPNNNPKEFEALATFNGYSISRTKGYM